MKLIRTIHKFFAGQALYPIVLSTMLALAFYAGRVYLSHNWLIYRNLVWNLFLAWIPYIFSVAAAMMYRVTPRFGWIFILPPGALWLVFFPNAPYIVTDFLHLTERPSVPLWYDILLVASFAWTGLFLAIASLRTMQWLVKNYLGLFVSWLFVGLAMGLGGLGIYLGRFERWNSWDLLFHYRSILADVLARVANPFENLRFLGFTALFTAFLLVCYLTFVSFRGLDES